nr:unnamed protein product [Digitaria exilis]
MASPGRSILPRPKPTASPRQLATLTDDLLQDIFLRICPTDLIRASAACVAFHRLINADPTFLRRYRAIHPPLLLGFLGVGIEGFQPAEAPHPNAPAARALHSAADFSFEFLPRREGHEWIPCDVRDGRVLLDASNPSHRSDGDSLVLGDLAVCEPLSRQYLLLPRIPEYLLTSVDIKEGNIDDFRASLVPSGDWEETSFKVLCTTHSRERLALGWAGRWPQFAYGCCYWKLRDQNELLKLEMNTLEFSIVDLPPNLIMLQNMGGVAIVEAGESILGMFSQIIDPQVRGHS